MPVNWQVGTLDNGLRVVTTPISTTQAVAVSLFVGVGSRGETRRTNGVSHYLEHMLFKGTSKRPNAALIAEAIEGAGGTLNAYTTKEMTCYWNQVPFNKSGIALDVVADQVRNSLMEQAEIDRERTVVQQEIRRNHDQPGAWVGRLLGQASYGDQPVGWDVAGTLDTVQGLTREDMTGHVGAWYVPNNMVLSVAGQIDHETVMTAAQDLFGDQAPVELAGLTPALEGLPEEHLVFEERAIEQCNLAMGLRALSRRDPDRYAQVVLNNVLGRGMSSRLFKEVRERRGLAYSVGSSYGRMIDTGLFSIHAGVTREHLMETIEVCLEELEKLVVEPVPADELERAREHAVGSYRLSLETAFSLGQRAGEQLLMHGEIEPIEDVVARLEAVNADDVQRLARRIFRRDNVAVAVVGPEADLDGVRTAVAA